MHPLPPRRPIPLPALRLTRDSRLRGMLLGMITSNSLAAFAQDVVRTQPTQPVRGVSPVGNAPAQEAGGSSPQARTLEAVPPMPLRPLPRGSLLDLRV